MKQRDAERIAKATQALLERFRTCVDKLSAREKVVLAALEPLATLNEVMAKEVEKWNELSVELDPDAEVAAAMDPPTVDIDDLTEAIEGAFESAHSMLAESIGLFEDILGNATDYEEPEEEEEVEEIVYTFSCDHPGCKEESPEEPSDASAKKTARALNWLVDGDEIYCPKHHPKPEETGEHFGCHSHGCDAESPGCDTLDEAEEAAIKAGWKFDPRGWPYCPRHRSEA